MTPSMGSSRNYEKRLLLGSVLLRVLGGCLRSLGGSLGRGGSRVLAVLCLVVVHVSFSL